MAPMELRHHNPNEIASLSTNGLRDRSDIPKILSDVSADLPLVAENGETFLEIYNRGNVMLNRHFLHIADPGLAAQFGLFTTDDLALLRLGPRARLPVTTPAQFLASNKRFMVATEASRPGWLLRWLEERATVRLESADGGLKVYRVDLGYR